MRLVPSGTRGVALAALGVVFGDIGTSPLYAMRQCFMLPNGVSHSTNNVLGAVSLILWSLVMVITVKYVAVMLKTDNRGEGGVLALSTLLSRATRDWRLWHPVAMVGVLGAALFFGDGFLTPAISVLSAVEGVAVAAPNLERFVVPFTLVILLALFAAQRKGTGAVGRVFGPVLVVWFLALATLGVMSIISTPQILQALNPYYGAEFFINNGRQGFIALSCVFLAVTGGEALYADMGHFGRLPIRNAWFQLVLPSLALNYLGQGALLIRDPTAVESPFYLLAPSWLLPPLIMLATAATIIASQAVISGVFSVTQQALNLGYLPRIRILHSSETEIGQIYVPTMNWILFAGTVLLVLMFKSSDALAGAYGIAVSATMLMAGVMVDMLAYITQKRRRWLTLSLLSSITLIDAAFFSSNVLRIVEGGWFPIAVALIIYTLMATWNEGRRTLNWTISMEQSSSRKFLDELASNPPAKVPGTAVYLASAASTIPRTMMQSVRFHGSLHERNVILTFSSAEVPTTDAEERVSIDWLAPGLVRVTARYGFMEQPNAVAILKSADELGLPYKPEETIYIVGRDTPIVTSKRGMANWRKRLFALMARNSQMAAVHFGIPPHKTLEMGTQTPL